jgi:hypothetical protein
MKKKYCLLRFVLFLIILLSSKVQALNVTAASGSAADIQTAVNQVAAAGVGNVFILAGTFNWNGETVTIPGGVNVFGASPAGCKGHEDNWEHYTATTILHNDAAQPFPDMFVVLGANGKQTRISGIQFEANDPSSEPGASLNSAISMREAKDFRIDHCTILNFAGTSIVVAAGTDLWEGEVGHSSYGVIDHCFIDVPYKDNGGVWEWGYGITAMGNMQPNLNNWNGGIRNYAGKYQAFTDVALVYIEDCNFRRTRHAVDGNGGAIMVTRYCLLDHIADEGNALYSNYELDAHPYWVGSQYPCVCIEDYYNKFVNDGHLSCPVHPGQIHSQLAMCLRGGSGLFFGNEYLARYPAPNWAATLIYLSDESPANSLGAINETYIWDEDGRYVNVWPSDADNDGIVDGFIKRSSNPTSQLNVNFFLRQPNLAQDGWTYTPYTYPHPLTLEGPSPTNTTTITANANPNLVAQYQNTILWCDYRNATSTTEILNANVKFGISASNYTASYNSSSKRYEYRYNSTTAGTQTIYCYASATNFESNSISFSLITSVPSYVSISGSLVDNNNNPLDASITVYQQGTSNVVATTQTSSGNYNLAVSPNVYDLQYTPTSFFISNFFISNFFIKLLPINISSSLSNVINSITNINNQNVLFIANISDSQLIQTYSGQRPARVLLNGTSIASVYSYSQLTNNTWFYNSSTNRLYTLVSTTCSDGTSYGQCSSNKPKYCNNGNLIDKCSQCGCSSGQCNTTSEICYTLPGQYKTFGYYNGTQDYGTASSDGLLGSNYSIPENGAAMSITAALRRDSAGYDNISMGIYRLSDLTLVGNTSWVNLFMTTSFKNYTFNFPIPLTLTANTQYVLTVFFDYTTTNMYLEYDNAPTGSHEERYASTTPPTWPSTFPSGGYWNRYGDIYVTYMTS